MRLVTAPDRAQRERYEDVLFIAGGITDCPDWQATLLASLGVTACRDWQTALIANLDDPPALLVLNPRRPRFDVGNTSLAREQIGWEYRALRLADAISFWFPAESLCPIVLYELGTWSMAGKPIFVGADPHYARRQDVVLQTELVRPDVEVVDTLSALAAQIIAWTRRGWRGEVLHDTAPAGDISIVERG